MATGETAFVDVEYDLVLLQYQSLKDYRKYVRDAKIAGLDDVASFFEQVIMQDSERAKRCHELLAKVHTTF
jgi:rubrerythrin